MPHLSEAEIVDWVDGTLSPARAAHVDSCSTCRRQAGQLRLDLGVIENCRDTISEPSPLFWDHLSQRVREAISDLEPGRRVRPRLFWPLWSATAASAVALILVVALWPRPDTVAPAPPPASLVQRHEPAENAGYAALDLEEDAEWALVRIAADDLQWEETHEAGLSARPGAADRVALEMSPEDRQELARLLETVLKGTGA